MDIEQARKEAVRICGPGTTIVKDGSWTRVLDGTKKELGKGRGHLEALRAAAAPILQKKLEEEQAQLAADRAEATRFITFLKEHHAAEYLAWRKAQDERNAARLAEMRAASAPAEPPSLIVAP